MLHSERTYRSEIDGLRAVSVIAVVLNHAGLLIPGGYAGVEVFFVISGFLITQLIMKDLKQNTFSLGDFWARRIRRILPALAVMVTVTLIAGSFLLSPYDLEQLGKSVVSQSLLMSNVYFLWDQGHPGMPTPLKPLAHTWSLAVEEQFYVFFPLLLLWCANLRRSRLITLLSCIAVISFVSSLYYVPVNRHVAFFLLPCRAWELLVGALVALVPSTVRLPKWTNELLAGLGSGAIYATLFWYDHTTPFPGLSAALPVIGTAAIIFANNSTNTFVGRLLSLSILTFVGKFSYSLYLWHWPIQVLFTYSFGGHHTVRIVGFITLSVVVSILSWYYIERPFRGHTPPAQRRLIFAGGLTAQFALLFVAVLIWRTGGLPQRLSTTEQLMLADLNHRNAAYDSFISALEKDAVPTLGIAPANSNLDFALIGDDQAICFAPLFDQIAKRNGLSGIVVARNDVPLLSVAGSVKKRNELLIRVLQERKVQHVIIAVSWEVYGGHEQPAISLAQLMKNIVSVGVNNVSILRQIPTQYYEEAFSRHVFAASRFPSAIALRRRTSKDHQPLLKQETDFFELVRSKAPAEFALIDTSSPCFDVNGDSRVQEQGRIYYLDSKHLTNIGAETLLTDTIESALQRTMKPGVPKYSPADSSTDAISSHDLPSDNSPKR